MTRELSITYAGYVVGGVQGNRLLDGKYRQTRSYEKSSVSFTVVVRGDTEAEFASECSAFEAAFRTPRGALTVTQGAVNLIAVTHTGNTGFNAAPVVSKSGGDGDTGRTRRYEVVIEFTEPADLAGQNGRRASTVERSYDPSRKATVMIQGTYTALGGSNARAVYDANSGAYFTAVLAAFGGTFEKVSERADHDDAIKELAFTVVFEEVIFNQAVGVLDHAGIVKPRLSVSVSKTAPGDSPEAGARRLKTIKASFDTSVDKTVVTDLPGLYTGTIRPFLIQQARAFGSTVALVNEDFQINGSDYTISASLTFLSVGASAALEYELLTEIPEAIGVVIMPVWGTTPYQAHVVPNPAVRQRIVTERRLVFGNVKLLDPVGPTPMDPLALASSAGPVTPQSGDRAGWITTRVKLGENIKTLGEDHTFEVTEHTKIFEQQWVELPSGGGVATG
ncbi:MAG TPA: hypothetical protein VJU16_08615 [Planctomycetota bacterium]|nr:hypothetical protein [Planctomycetota bacterium]